MKVVTTGSRHLVGETGDLIVGLALATPKPTRIAHGDCPTGADQIVDRLARVLGLEPVPYPAMWNQHGAAAGPIRNGHMLDAEQPDVVAAFWDGRMKRCGTFDCILQAVERQIEVRIYPVKIA